MVGEKEGVGVELELHNVVVSKILKLWRTLVEPLEETNVTILVLEESVEAVKAEVIRVVLFL